MTMYRLLSLLLLMPVAISAQPDSVVSGMYPWKQPHRLNANNISSVVLFEGKVHDMEWIQMSSRFIASVKNKFKQNVPVDEEHLLIIQTGTVSISIKDSVWSIGGGSIALLMPREKYYLQNSGNIPCSYYLLRYRSKIPVNISRGNSAGGSFVKDWNKISFLPNNNGGGRRNYFERATAMSKKFEMHVTTLKEGIRSHDPHTHRAEEIVLMIEGNTEMQIGEKFYKGKTGDLYYLGTNVLHAIRNEGTKPCRYFAFQFE
jgi:(S)-ureidoglycine aminohydrolase